MMKRQGNQFYVFKETEENTSPGVYVLKMCGVPVYIGSAKNPYKRVSTHIYSKRFSFDEIRYINCPEHELLELERKMIYKEKPVLNNAHNPEYNSEAAKFYRSFSFKIKPREYHVKMTAL